MHKVLNKLPEFEEKSAAVLIHKELSTKITDAM
jgi:hypothetical protein